MAIYAFQPNQQISNSRIQVRSHPVHQHKRLPQVQVTYAAGKESFIERIKEELDVRIIEAPLTRGNYKEKFHHMVCWEEMTHINILHRR